MSVRSYKILIILLILIICSILLYPIIIDINPNIHGSYMFGHDNNQNIISFDSSTNIYHRYVGGVLIEFGTFNQSNIDNIYFIENNGHSSYIILNKDSTFYFIDHNNNYILLFEKHSEGLTSIH